MGDKSFDNFDADKLIGHTGSGKPYLRPSSSSNDSVGFGNALNRFRRTGNLASANLTRGDAQEIQRIISDQLSKKSTSRFNRQDRSELKHKLEQSYRSGKLSSSDIKDAESIIDKLSD